MMNGVGGFRGSGEVESPSFQGTEKGVRLSFSLL